MKGLAMVVIYIDRVTAIHLLIAVYLLLQG